MALFGNKKDKDSDSLSQDGQGGVASDPAGKPPVAGTDPTATVPTGDDLASSGASDGSFASPGTASGVDKTSSPPATSTTNPPGGGEATMPGVADPTGSTTTPSAGISPMESGSSLTAEPTLKEVMEALKRIEETLARIESRRSGV